MFTNEPNVDQSMPRHQKPNCQPSDLCSPESENTILLCGFPIRSNTIELSVIYSTGYWNAMYNLKGEKAAL